MGGVAWAFSTRAGRMALTASALLAGCPAGRLVAGAFRAGWELPASGSDTRSAWPGRGGPALALWRKDPAPMKPPPARRNARRGGTRRAPSPAATHSRRRRPEARCGLKSPPARLSRAPCLGIRAGPPPSVCQSCPRAPNCGSRWRSAPPLPGGTRPGRNGLRSAAPQGVYVRTRPLHPFRRHPPRKSLGGYPERTVCGSRAGHPWSGLPNAASRSAKRPIVLWPETFSTRRTPAAQIMAAGSQRKWLEADDLTWWFASGQPRTTCTRPARTWAAMPRSDDANLRVLTGPARPRCSRCAWLLAGRSNAGAPSSEPDRLDGHCRQKTDGIQSGRPQPPRPSLRFRRERDAGRHIRPRPATGAATAGAGWLSRLSRHDPISERIAIRIARQTGLARRRRRLACSFEIGDAERRPGSTGWKAGPRLAAAVELDFCRRRIRRANCAMPPLAARLAPRHAWSRSSPAGVSAPGKDLLPLAALESEIDRSAATFEVEGHGIPHRNRGADLDEPISPAGLARKRR